MSIGKNPIEHVITFPNGVRAKRSQYGLRNRIACTIHKAMGDTISWVCTSVKDDDPRCGIWLKEQLVVLLSRTQYLSQISFVGTSMQTTGALRRIMQKKSQYMEYSNHILQVLTQNEDVLVQRVDNLPYRPCDDEIPDSNSGYSYCLVSLRDCQTTSSRTVCANPSQHPRAWLPCHHCQ